MLCKYIEELNDKQFCMMFIDADKSGYLDYLKWANTHVKQGGFIIADNTLAFGNVYIPDESSRQIKSAQVIHEFNKKLANTKKYHTVILPTAGGLSIAKKFIIHRNNRKTAKQSTIKIFHMFKRKLNSIKQNNIKI